MDKFLSPVELSHLEAFRFWLHGTVPEWDISLPVSEIVKTGKDYPPFYLYQNGALAGMVEALKNIGNIQLLKAYLREMMEDPDNPSA